MMKELMENWHKTADGWRKITLLVYKIKRVSKKNRVELFLNPIFYILIIKLINSFTKNLTTKMTLKQKNLKIWVRKDEIKDIIEDPCAKVLSFKSLLKYV